MADDDGFMLTGEAVRRIDRIVRAVGGGSGSGGRLPASGPAPAETCWGKLTALVDEDRRLWEWVEVFRRKLESTGAVTWQTVEGGRSGDEDADAPNLAYEVAEGVAAADAVVLLRRLNTRNDPSSPSAEKTWSPGWGIVGAAAGPTMPTALYQVNTPIDSTLVPVWTSLRFMATG